MNPAALSPANRNDFALAQLLRLGPFVARGDGYRFGARRIRAATVARLVALGLAVMAGDQVVAS